MDIALMMLTFVLTIAWDIEVGIAVSLIISLLLVVRRSAKPRMTILVRQLDLCIKHQMLKQNVWVIGSCPRYHTLDTY